MPDYAYGLVAPVVASYTTSNHRQVTTTRVVFPFPSLLLLLTCTNSQLKLLCLISPRNAGEAEGSRHGLVHTGCSVGRYGGVSRAVPGIHAPAQSRDLGEPGRSASLQFRLRQKQYCQGRSPRSGSARTPIEALRFSTPVEAFQRCPRGAGNGRLCGTEQSFQSYIDRSSSAGICAPGSDAASLVRHCVSGKMHVSSTKHLCRRRCCLTHFELGSNESSTNSPSKILTQQAADVIYDHQVFGWGNYAHSYRGAIG